MGAFTEDMCPRHHFSYGGRVHWRCVSRAPYKYPFIYTQTTFFFWDQYNSSPLHSWGRWSLKTEQAARKLRRPDLEATQLSWMHCLARIRSSVLWVWGRNRIPCFLVLPIRLSLMFNVCFPCLSVLMYSSSSLVLTYESHLLCSPSLTP